MRLRETELKYSSVMNGRVAHEVLNLLWESLSTLDELEDRKDSHQSPELVEGLRRLRANHHRQIKLLLRYLDETYGEEDLGELRSLLSQRRTELKTLPGSEEGVERS
ncbi:hypothetical protein I2487_13205 [Nesterenkonia sp. E16_10]|uniref:hypothetical protein n=1 Tax=Nesterenkonia sp. E16_10 TaxID=2789296 RepID=UPI001A911686|nr:hypothetical protein [Nesterenkonia sp. E16_10]MBO0596606.1 hypothetical protein [Nesterenkonia sp. E16_10]